MSKERIEEPKESGDAFATYLETIRQRLGISRKQLVRNSGLKYDTIAKWEQGETHPKDRDSARRLCDGLGLGSLSEERSRLFWLAGGWPTERPQPRAGLPSARCQKFYGRDRLIDNICARLQHPQLPRTILISAFGGYGKTEFARYVAQKLTASRAFADAVWLSLKTAEFNFTEGSIQAVDPPLEPSLPNTLQILKHRLGCQSDGEVASRLSTEAILIIVDNLESIPQSEREAVVSRIHHLLGSGPSRAIFTSRFDLVPPYIDKPEFPGLTYSETVQFIRGEAEFIKQPGASRLLEASPKDTEDAHVLTLGMPLALHLLVARVQRYPFKVALENLGRARAYGQGSDLDFYTFLYKQTWQELSVQARDMLVYLATATHAPQPESQLLGIALSTNLPLEKHELDDALAELSSWCLIELLEPWGPGQGYAYDLHPLTRSFVHQPEVRETWEEQLPEKALRAASAKKHEGLFHRAFHPSHK